MGKDTKPSPADPEEQPARSNSEKTFGEMIMAAGDAAVDQMKKDMERQRRIELLQHEKRRAHQIFKELRTKNSES